MACMGRYFLPFMGWKSMPHGGPDLNQENFHSNGPELDSNGLKTHLIGPGEHPKQSESDLIEGPSEKNVSRATWIAAAVT